MGAESADAGGAMSPWDRVANKFECRDFVFTVVAVHLGLRPEDRYREPWNRMALGIVGQMRELTELWQARRFWARHAKAVIEELRHYLAVCPPEPKPRDVREPRLRSELLALTAELQAQASRPADGEYALGIRAGLNAASSLLAARAEQTHPYLFDSVNDRQLAADLGLPPMPDYYSWLNRWPTLDDPDRPTSARRREITQAIVRKWIPDIDSQVCAQIAEEIDELLPPVEDIIRERQRLNPHEATIQDLIEEFYNRYGYDLHAAYNRFFTARALEAEADKLIPTQTGGGTEFSRGYDQALISVAHRLRQRAQQIRPPFPISELGREDA